MLSWGRTTQPWNLDLQDGAGLKLLAVLAVSPNRTKPPVSEHLKASQLRAAKDRR